jgi:hypothetical protein
MGVSTGTSTGDSARAENAEPIEQTAAIKKHWIQRMSGFLEYGVEDNSSLPIAGLGATATNESAGRSDNANSIVESCGVIERTNRFRVSDEFANATSSLPQPISAREDSKRRSNLTEPSARTLFWVTCSSTKEWGRFPRRRLRELPINNNLGPQATLIYCRGPTVPLDGIRSLRFSKLPTEILAVLFM